MADYDSSLPIRTEAAGDVDVFLSDATTPSQKLKVNADGSIDTNMGVGSKIIVTDGTDDLEINADGSLNAVVTATDLDIRSLDNSSDSVTAHQGGSWSATVDAVSLDIRALDAAVDSIAAHLFDEAGVAFSALNPLPVIMSSDAEGDEICNFNTTASVAANASTNHDYTVTSGKTLLIAQAWVSASGKCKAELLVNGVLKFVGFNSTANPNVDIPVGKFLKGLTTEVVRITVTNLDRQAQDLYSTLSGLEL